MAKRKRKKSEDIVLTEAPGTSKLVCRDCILHLACVSKGLGKGPHVQCPACGKVVHRLNDDAYVLFYCPYLNHTSSTPSPCPVCQWLHPASDFVVYNLNTAEGRELFALRQKLHG